jgi:ATP-binding cassette subfamily B protein
MQATRKLAHFLRLYRLWAVLAPLLMMLEVGMDLMQPRLVQRIIDEGIAQLDLSVVMETAVLDT